MDTLTKSERSRRMALIRGKDTKPEIAVRKLIHSMGYRYRLHRADIPGKPDLVFGPRRKVIFIHGCFWHCHSGCKNARMPKSKIEFWKPKLESNAKRDKRVRWLLRKQGWKTMTIWECEVKDERRLRSAVRKFLGRP